MNSKLTLNLSSIATAALLAASSASSAAASVVVHTSTATRPDFTTIMPAIDKAKTDIRDAAAKVVAYREEIETNEAEAEPDAYQAEHFTELGEFLQKVGAVDADSYKTMLTAFRSGGKKAALAYIEKAAKDLNTALGVLETRIAICSEQSDAVSLSEIVAGNMVGNPALAVAKVMVTQAAFIDLVTSAALIVVEDNYTHDGNGSLTAGDFATGDDSGQGTGAKLATA